MYHQSKIVKRKAVTLVLLSLYIFVLLPLSPLWAQSPSVSTEADIIAPSVLHDPPSGKIQAGTLLTIRATITDDVGVKEAILFYRPIGTEDYRSLKLKLSDGNLYSATIPKEEVVVPGIEYYFEASDQVENIQMRGFSFSPLTLAVSPMPIAPPAPLPVLPPAPKKEIPPPVVKEVPAMVFEQAKPLASQPDPVVKPWYKKWWVWAIVGGVVVGAAAAGGGGVGGGTSAGTGDVVINGPPAPSQ